MQQIKWVIGQMEEIRREWYWSYMYVTCPSRFPKINRPTDF